MIYTETK